MGGARLCLRHLFPKRLVFPAPPYSSSCSRCGFTEHLLCATPTDMGPTGSFSNIHRPTGWAPPVTTQSKGAKQEDIKGSEVAPLTSPGRAREEGEESIQERRGGREEGCPWGRPWQVRHRRESRRGSGIRNNCSLTLSKGGEGRASGELQSPEKPSL